MTAKELIPGMKLDTPRWGTCEVLWTYQAGKWLNIVMCDSRLRMHVVAKFPGSLVTVMGEVEHQP